MSNWEWREGEVDRSRHHIRLTCGDTADTRPQDLRTVAFVGKPSKGVFHVQLVVSGHEPAEAEMMDAVRRQLDFYLVEKGEDDPWAYALYHCNTAASLCSRVHWSASAGVLADWNGDEIPIARSTTSSVLVTGHPFDNLIRPSGIEWPPAEIVQKLYKSRQERGFSGLDAAVAKSVLGFYCDLQSLHSEDAITWSIFGPLAYAGIDQRESWLRDLLTLLGLERVSASGATVALWRRMPHPDTLAPGGPEIDFSIVTENAVLLGEAKWLSGLGVRQGKAKDKDQVQIRAELLANYGQRFFPGKAVHAIVGIGLFPGAFPESAGEGIALAAASWQDLCCIPSHPHADEVKRYFEWKRENTIVPKRRTEADGR